jgi:hypothetical protein
MSNKTLSLLEVRYWLESALKAHGASVGKVGIGHDPPVAKINIDLDGCDYVITIRPDHEDDFDDCD